MAKKAELVEVIETTDEMGETPSFRHALLSIRSLDDIKAIITHEEYDPHVHMVILLTATFFVGMISFLVGA
jgi:hypothetical protein